VTENSDAAAVHLNGVRLDEPHAQPQGQPQPRPGGADAPRRPRASAGVKRPIPSRPDPETAARTAPANGPASNGTSSRASSAMNGAANGSESQPSEDKPADDTSLDDGSADEIPARKPAPTAADSAAEVGDGADAAPDAAAAAEDTAPDSDADAAADEPELTAGQPERQGPESPAEQPDAGPYEEDPVDDAQQERPTPSRPRLDVVDTVGRLLGGGDWERRAARGLAFLRRRITGDYEIDEFGFDRELTENVLLGMFRPLYERYFRVETRGIEHVPDKGGVLIVANHSGTLPLDAVMTQVALADHHPAHRSLRMLAADVVFTMPFIGELARKAGHTLACNPDAERLLCAGEVVGVWPEGFKGIGKPFADRYRLQRFGRGGFVSAALRTGTPIVPTAIVGAEEIYPKIGDIKPLARLLGLPYVPVTPTFPWLGPAGLIPLPSKWYIAFGEPIDTSAYDPGAADDPMLVFNLTDQVRETIQDTLYRLLLQRRSVFF